MGGVLAAEIEGRFATAVEAALRRAPRRPPEGFRFGLPRAVSAALAEAAERVGRLPDVLAEYYLERMPRLLVEQMFVDDDPAARLLWRAVPAGAQPRRAAALAGVARIVGRTHPPDASAAALHARGLFGGSAPLLGAFPAQRALMNEELARGADPDAVLDLRLSGNLVHELCHGQPAPMPWTILESIAVAVGARARPEHMFPEVDGEAVPGVALFVCLGDVLTRLYGEPWPILDGADPESVFGAAAAVFAEAGWQAWMKAQTAPFVLHALDAFAWAKLAGGARSLDDDPPWSDLAWFHEEPTAEDAAMLATGVRALFQVNVIRPTFQTLPCELPGATFFVDLEACTMTARPRPEGVFGEPARWIAPPPFCRVLRERGARRVVVEGARHRRHREIAAALWELAFAGPLPETVTCSP